MAIAIAAVGVVITREVFAMRRFIVTRSNDPLGTTFWAFSLPARYNRTVSIESPLTAFEMRTASVVDVVFASVVTRPVTRVQRAVSFGSVTGVEPIANHAETDFGVFDITRTYASKVYVVDGATGTSTEAAVRFDGMYGASIPNATCPDSTCPTSGATSATESASASTQPLMSPSALAVRGKVIEEDEVALATTALCCGVVAAAGSGEGATSIAVAIPATASVAAITRLDGCRK
ncbi:hypothetical protein [Microbacterium sp.]|uniref:hypothetical protein n=1 Tax=Microbacterium sp. TaxID=51671 RepID=UPI003736844A